MHNIYTCIPTTHTLTPIHISTHIWSFEYPLTHCCCMHGRMWAHVWVCMFGFELMYVCILLGFWTRLYMYWYVWVYIYVFLYVYVYMNTLIYWIFCTKRMFMIWNRKSNLYLPIHSTFTITKALAIAIAIATNTTRTMLPAATDPATEWQWQFWTPVMFPPPTWGIRTALMILVGYLGYHHNTK